MKKPVTLSQAISYLADADRAFDYAKWLRWPDNEVTCPRCGSDSNSFVKTRKLWFCNGCKKQFTVKVGTIFEDSPIGLDKWMTAVWMICNCKNGISSYELHRNLGVTQKTAWFMLHRIREAMRSGDFTRMGSGGGPVEVDEAYIGGKPQNMHIGKRQQLMALYGERPPKPAVVGMLDRETRQVRTKVLPKIERGTLMAEILNGVKHGVPLYTDSHAGYSGAERHFIHETVNHMNEYVRGEVHVNGLENFWSLLKRGLRGTYVAVEPFHLHRYADEQVFRFNNRATKDNPLTDEDRFVAAMSQIVGRRVTYATLTGHGAD